MKKLVLLLSAASMMMVACNNAPEAASTTAATPAVNPIDTAGLAAYNASKAVINELPEEQPAARQSQVPAVAKAAAPKARTVTRYRYVDVPKS
ncbi:MAG: hypothetical protein EOP50_14120, partial [Sphingobacteriales bacterium]